MDPIQELRPNKRQLRIIIAIMLFGVRGSITTHVYCRVN